MQHFNMSRIFFKFICISLLLNSGICFSIVASANFTPQNQEDHVIWIGWNADNSILAIAKRYGGVYLYDTNLQEVGRINIPIYSPLEWSPDGQHIALVTKNENLELQIWNTANLTKSLTIYPHVGDFISISWKSDGTQIITGGGEVGEIWDTLSGQLVNTLETGAEPRTDLFVTLAWNPIQQLIATDGIDDETAIWNATTGELLDTMIPAGYLAWNSNGSQLAIGTRDTIYIVDINTNQVIRTIQLNTRNMYNLVWQNNTIASSHLTEAGASVINLIEATTGDMIDAINVNHRIFSIALNSDGSFLAYGNQDGSPQIVPIVINDCTPTQTVAAGDVAGFISAINTANANPDASVIGVEGTYTFTAVNNGLNALPKITTDIKICSQNGATLIRQAGSPAFRFFEVASNGTLTLENLTLTGADSGSEPGGAILNTGNLTVNNVTFTGNHAGTWR